MLKRTERLIDAVKLIRLLETMEGKDAELTIKRTEGIWKMDYHSGKLRISNSSESLDKIVERTINYIEREKKNAE